MDLCVKSDLYDFGLPRGSIPNPGRLIASIDPFTGIMQLGDHGLETGQAIRFRPDVGGCMPIPLTAGPTYYAIAVDDSRFRVALTADGPAVTLGSAGEAVVLILPLPIASAIRFASRILEEAIIAHGVPLEAPTIADVPEIIRLTAAELAAWKLGLIQGARSSTLGEAVDAAIKRVAAWAKGVPVRGVQNATPPNTATNLAVSSATCTRTDPDGWGRFGGL